MENGLSLYSASRYNIVVETYDGGLTVHNSRTGGITHFEKKLPVVRDALESGVCSDIEIYKVSLILGCG
jgi:hypothetical protein